MALYLGANKIAGNITSIIQEGEVEIPEINQEVVYLTDLADGLYKCTYETMWASPVEEEASGIYGALVTGEQQCYLYKHTPLIGGYFTGVYCQPFDVRLITTTGDEIISVGTDGLPSSQRSISAYQFEKVQARGIHLEKTEQEIGTFMGETLYRRTFCYGGQSNSMNLNEMDECSDLYTYDESTGVYTFDFYPVKINVTYFMYDSTTVDQCGWYSGPAISSDGTTIVTPIITFDRDSYTNTVKLKWDFLNLGNNDIGDVIITVEYTRDDWGSISDWNMPG